MPIYLSWVNSESGDEVRLRDIKRWEIKEGAANKDRSSKKFDSGG